MSFHYHSYELPEVQSVSPIDIRPYSWKEPTHLPNENEKDRNGHRLSEVSLSDDDITTSRLPFTSIQFENENGEMLSDKDRSFSTQAEPIRSSFLEPKSQRFFSIWTIAISSAISTILTISYSYIVLVSPNAVPKHLVTSPGTTVLIVNILSHLVAFLVWGLFGDTLEALRWALACRTKGVLLTSFLALSRATQLSGVMYLCTTQGSHQLWAIWR